MSIKLHQSKKRLVPYSMTKDKQGWSKWSYVDHFKHQHKMKLFRPTPMMKQDEKQWGKHNYRGNEEQRPQQGGGTWYLNNAMGSNESIEKTNNNGKQCGHEVSRYRSNTDSRWGHCWQAMPRLVMQSMSIYSKLGK